MTTRSVLFAAPILFLVVASTTHATITIKNNDGPNEGLNDKTNVAKVSGNSATTRGGQRLNVLKAAANDLDKIVNSSVTAVIDVTFDPLSCSASSATLGSAGASFVWRDFSGAPKSGTWYVQALANALRGSDIDASSEVVARFNSSVDNNNNCLQNTNWWYGIGQDAPAGTTSLYDTAYHEIVHGLGFTSSIDRDTGALLSGFPDSYTLNLEDHSRQRTLDKLNNAQRLAAMTDTGDLHWVGKNALAAALMYAEASPRALTSGKHPSGHVRMYAPKPFEDGSSVSHWDTTLRPDEIMEPIATKNQSDTVTTPALQDIGWSTNKVGSTDPCSAAKGTICLGLDNRFEFKASYEFSNGNTGKVDLIRQGRDSALGHFGDENNIELLMKIKRACGLVNLWWVFVGGTTDQGITVDVRDTTTGQINTSVNRVGQKFRTVTGLDSNFPCP